MKDKEREGVAVWLDPTKPALVQPLLMLLSSVKATRFATLLFFGFLGQLEKLKILGSWRLVPNYERIGLRS